MIKTRGSRIEEGEERQAWNMSIHLEQDMLTVTPLVFLSFPGIAMQVTVAPQGKVEAANSIPAHETPAGTDLGNLVFVLADFPVDPVTRGESMHQALAVS